MLNAEILQTLCRSLWNISIALLPQIVFSGNIWSSSCLGQGGVVCLEAPPLAPLLLAARLHHQLVLGLGQGEALAAGGVAQGAALVAVLPPLVAAAPVTPEQDDVGAGEVDAVVVPPDLPLLGQHPVLVTSLQRSEAVK